MKLKQAILRRISLLLAALVLPLACLQAEEEYLSLFNGTDLTGWDGDPALWKVENGIIIGTCAGPGTPEHNTFLIWQGGTVKDFKLRVVARIRGDNNSGIQYRSRKLPEFGEWAISGYQCDVHPAQQHLGMTYEERGRGIFGLNGQSVILDPEGQRWLITEHPAVEADVSQWTEYVVIASGNHLIHQVNGELTSQLTDFHQAGRAMEGLLAIQLHRGNAHTVEIRSIELQKLPKGDLIEFENYELPEEAKPLRRPRTRNPQGVAAPAR